MKITREYCDMCNCVEIEAGDKCVRFFTKDNGELRYSGGEEIDGKVICEKCARYMNAIFNGSSL